MEKIKLEIHDLVKRYGDLEALRNITITFENGIYALLGPNGAGKSTLMNILATLLKQNEGQILCNDKPLDKQRETYLDMLGYMPQKQCLYEDFTLKDFMYYIGNLKGMKKQNILQRTDYLLKEMRLDSVLHNKISTFSGGMKQRSMLAATLINDPRIVILDEPTAGLDPMKRLEMQNLIASFAKDKIIIIATHVVSDVEFIANQFLFLKKGEILLKGDRLQILQCLEGKVKEKETTLALYNELKHTHIISSIHYQKEKLIARFIDVNNQIDGIVVSPTISDVYYYLFKEQKDDVL